VDAKLVKGGVIRLVNEGVIRLVKGVKWVMVGSGGTGQ
jgi:hypothetical protein